MYGYCGRHIAALISHNIQILRFKNEVFILFTYVTVVNESKFTSVPQRKLLCNIINNCTYLLYTIIIL